MGQEEAPSFLENDDMSVPEKGRGGTEERDQKLQGGRAHVGDVEVVCDLYFLKMGKRPGWRS